VTWVRKQTLIEWKLTGDLDSPVFMKKIDATGKKFGRLTLVERIPEFRKITKYKCLCDCGKETIALWTNLNGGNTRSCGCIKDERLRARKQPDAEIQRNAIWRYYRRNAKIRSVIWELTKEQFNSLIAQECKYCGHTGPTGFVGVDRVDNTLGYTFHNCVPCCRWCNWGKNERTLEEFRKWIEDLYARRFFH
jgi:hypothetical protein